jgi:hypothetical protein
MLIEGSKPMHIAADGGNVVRLKHVRFRASVRAERRAAILAAAEEKRIRDARWAELMPVTDYAAICEEIRRKG